MTPLAATLLCASRYAHLRSLHPYEDVIRATREVWHLIDPVSRVQLLRLWKDQIPKEIGHYIETQGGSIIPVSTLEAAQELAAWKRLWCWCEARMEVKT